MSAAGAWAIDAPINRFAHARQSCAKHAKTTIYPTPAKLTYTACIVSIGGRWIPVRPCRSGAVERVGGQCAHRSPRAPTAGEDRNPNAEQRQGPHAAGERSRGVKYRPVTSRRHRRLRGRGRSRHEAPIRRRTSLETRTSASPALHLGALGRKRAGDDARPFVRRGQARPHAGLSSKTRIAPPPRRG